MNTVLLTATIASTVTLPISNTIAFCVMCLMVGVAGGMLVEQALRRMEDDR